METLWQDLRYGARMLGRNPGFTAVAVLTLALGIGANTAIFSVVNAVLLRPLPYTHPERIVTLAEKARDGEASNVGYATYVDWRANSRRFEHLAAYRSWGPSLTGEGPPQRLSGLRVSQPFFSLLGVRPAVGRDFLPDDDRPDNSGVVILSHGLWQRRFGGDPEVVGRPVTLSGRNYTVVGVLPASFQSVVSTLAYDPAEIWRPLGYDVSQPWACRTCRHLRAIGRLSPGVSLERAQAEIETITSNLKQDFPHKYSGQGVALVRLHDRMVGNVRLALLVLLGAVGFVLLIACANVANLLLARAANREKEIAIRAALGAGRRRLLRQLVTESLLLAVLGGATGLLLALWGVDALLALSPADLPRLNDVRVDSWVLAFAFGASLLAGLIFGFAPAWRSSRLDLNQALKQEGRSPGGGGGHGLRNLLVVVETALALALLIGGALLSNSFIRLSRVDPGFDRRNVLTLNLSLSGTTYPKEQQALAFHRQVAERIRALPGVESVGWVSNLPLSGNYDQYSMPIEDRPEIVPPNLPSVERYVVSTDYLRTMRIPLLRGRLFTEQDAPEAPGVVLINETLARRFWPNEDPQGKRIQLGFNRWRTIVGIVGDVRHYGLASAPTLQAYIPHAQAITYSNSWVVRTAADPAGVASAVRNAVWAVDPNQPVYDISTLSQLGAASVAQQRFTMVLLGMFATVALLLAAVGIYGVISYSVSRRTHEIGIRMALGAQPGDILKLVVGQGMGLTLIGVGVGLAASFALTRFLSSLLFGVSATDPATFIGVAFLLAGVALLACYVPARRAIKVDPMVALRYE